MISVNKEIRKRIKVPIMENKPIQIALAGRLSGVGEYYFSKKLREIDQMRAAGQDIISLGVGGPDQPPHPKLSLIHI